MIFCEVFPLVSPNKSSDESKTSAGEVSVNVIQSEETLTLSPVIVLMTTQLG